MAGPAILKIDIIADATKAINELNKTGGAATKTGGAFSKAGKVIAGAVGTAAVVGFGKASFAAAEESAQATARLEQVFSSMGETTGEAAKAASDYASSLSSKIAVDDEAIMAAQAQLATFGEVSNEVARGAGVFDRATAAAADLAAAGFGTLDANSVQLGKALQDPTKGLAALAKSGVTFTQAQKDQIAAMQKSGDLLGAQKIVLEAVEGQVKGTAAATATGSQKMAIAFGEVQEQVGAFLLPAMTKLTNIFVKYKDLILPVGAAIVGLVVGVKAITFATKAWTAAGQLWSAATKVWTGIQAAFNLVMAANPIVLVVIAIAALIAAVVLAYQNVGWFRDLVDAAMKAIVVAFNWVVDAAKTVFNWIKDNWPLLLAIITGPIGLAVLAVVKNWESIQAAAKAVWDWIKETWSTVLDMIKKPVEDAKDAAVTAWEAITTAAKAVWDWINTNWPLLLAIITGPVGLAVLAIKTHWTTITNTAQTVIDWFKTTWSTLVDIVKAPFELAATAVSTAWNLIKNFFTDLPEKIRVAFLNLAETIKSPFKAAFNAIAGFWNSSIGGVGFKVPSWVPGFGGNEFKFPNMPTLMYGGTVLRTGLAVVHAGEQFSGVGRTFSSGGNVININVTTTGLGADAPQIQRAVANALRGYTARNGPLDIPVRGVA